MALVAGGPEGVRGEGPVKGAAQEAGGFIKALGLRDVVLMNIVAVVGMRWIARGART